MKTEQEQIEEIVKIILEASKKCFDTDCNCCDDQYEKDCAQYRKAVALVQAGYGDISEYKAEIEWLKDENCELTKKLEARLTCDFVRTAQKQAQIDAINTIVKYCETPNHWNELKDCKLWGGKSDDLRDFLNGIFKEVTEQ